MGIALHVGEVVYGNIGTPGRLDFTVIGEAVNRVARGESMWSPELESRCHRRHKGREL